MSIETDVLDDLDVLRIELGAVSACCERRDFDPLRPPGEQMIDNDYRAGIRETFAACDEWEDWMVEPLLAEVNRRVRERMAIEGFASMLVGAVGRIGR